MTVANSCYSVENLFAVESAAPICVLLKYLDVKIASYEETPEEHRARQDREREEFFATPMPKRRKA